MVACRRSALRLNLSLPVSKFRLIVAVVFLIDAGRGLAINFCSEPALNIYGDLLVSPPIPVDCGEVSPVVRAMEINSRYVPDQYKSG